MLADEVDYVIGVDTHRDQHTLAVVGAPTGAVLAQTKVRASARGYADALSFAEKHARGVRAWAIEGAGHYGAGLTRYLSGHAEAVLEVGGHVRVERRVRGEDDPLDAVRAARAGLGGRDADPATRGTAPGGAARVAARTPQRRRRSSRRA